MKKLAPACVLLIALATLTVPPAGLSHATDTALAQKLKSHVAFLASDSLEGRLVGTQGIEKAAEYIVMEFRNMGLEPLFGNSYRQEFEIEFGRDVVDTPSLNIAGIFLGEGRDFKAVPISASGKARGSCVISSAKLPKGADLTESILFKSIDPEVEAQRWTVVGHDGLLDWMHEIATQAHSQGAEAVVFVASKEKFHFFPIRRTYPLADICVVEISRDAFQRIFEAPPEADTLTSYDTMSCEIAIEMRPRKIKVANLGGIIRGKTGKHIVIGAHYDHLGHGEIASSTPWRREVHNGADDNASGVAVLIEAARLAATRKPDRSIAFLSFTAEELGAVGSEYFVKHCPFPLDSIIAMVNLDTVGRLENNRLIVFGAKSADEFGRIFDELARRFEVEMVQKKEIFGFSDQNPFYARKIPSLHLFTGAQPDYHSPDDDWENLNYDGMATITSIVGGLLARLSSSQTSITPVVVAEEKAPSTSRGHGAFLGIVPDFSYAGTGVGIKGTIPKSPAEAAGLQSGDIIVGIDTEPIGDLEALMRVLVSKKPGDEIEIKIMRSSKVLHKHATLGVRSERK